MESEPSPERIALFIITCAEHGKLAGNIGMDTVKGIVEAHREFLKCDAVIKPSFSGYAISSNGRDD